MNLLLKRKNENLNPAACSSTIESGLVRRDSSTCRQEAHETEFRRTGAQLDPGRTTCCTHEYTAR